MKNKEELFKINVSHNIDKVFNDIVDVKIEHEICGKRIDMLVHCKESCTIIEFKLVPEMENIGQLLTYKYLVGKTHNTNVNAMLWYVDKFNFRQFGWFINKDVSVVYDKVLYYSKKNDSIKIKSVEYV